MMQSAYSGWRSRLGMFVSQGPGFGGGLMGMMVPKKEARMSLSFCPPASCFLHSTDADGTQTMPLYKAQDNQNVTQFLL